MLERVFAAGAGGVPVITVEDHAVINGFGTAVLEHAQQHRYETRMMVRLGLPDRFIAHASRGEQLKEVGLDATGIARSVRAAVEELGRGKITVTVPVAKRVTPQMR